MLMIGDLWERERDREIEKKKGNVLMKCWWNVDQVSTQRLKNNMEQHKLGRKDKEEVNVHVHKIITPIVLASTGFIPSTS